MKAINVVVEFTDKSKPFTHHDVREFVSDLRGMIVRENGDLQITTFYPAGTVASVTVTPA